jgi:hypothetical protein
MRKIFSLATLFERRNNLNLILPIILNQADILYVNLVNYDEIPNILKNEKIIINRFDNAGAEVKFTNYNDINDDDYFFTIDDDIIYPEDYSDKLIENMLIYDNNAVCCVHGSNIDLRKKEEIHSTRGVFGRKSYHFTSELKENKLVMIPGTGTSCFFKKTFNLELSSLKIKNMVDPYIGCLLFEQKILTYSIMRNSLWLKAIETNSKTIYGNNPFIEIDKIYLSTFK